MASTSTASVSSPAAGTSATISAEADQQRLDQRDADHAARDVADGRAGEVDEGRAARRRAPARRSAATPRDEPRRRARRGSPRSRTAARITRTLPASPATACSVHSPAPSSGLAVAAEEALEVRRGELPRPSAMLVADHRQLDERRRRRRQVDPPGCRHARASDLERVDQARRAASSSARARSRAPTSGQHRRREPRAPAEPRRGARRRPGRRRRSGPPTRAAAGGTAGRRSSANQAKSAEQAEPDRESTATRSGGRGVGRPSARPRAARRVSSDATRLRPSRTDRPASPPRGLLAAARAAGDSRAHAAHR